MVLIKLFLVFILKTYILYNLFSLKLSLVFKHSRNQYSSLNKSSRVFSSFFFFYVRACIVIYVYTYRTQYLVYIPDSFNKGAGNVEASGWRLSILAIIGNYIYTYKGVLYVCCIFVRVFECTCRHCWLTEGLSPPILYSFEPFYFCAMSHATRSRSLFIV